MVLNLMIKGVQMIVGKNINYLRRKNNLTQEELAAKIFVSRQAVSKWENGEVVPDSLNLMELSKLFNVKVDDLLMVDLEIDNLNENVIETKADELPKKSKNKFKLLIIVGLVLILSIVAIYLNKEALFSIKEIDNEQEEIIEETIDEIDYSKLLSAGREFSVFIDSNGKLNGYGDNTYHQLDFDNWSDITQIAAGGFHTLGLKADGTVLATGYNNSGQIDVSSWSDITQVAAGRYHSLGLKADKTVVCVGENKFGQCNVSSWSDIIQVSAGRYNSYGLKSDGTVISTTDNEYGQAEVSSWNDIKQVSAGTYQVLGLRNDGTVVCVGGQQGDEVCNVSSWTDIKQVVGAGYHSIGLKNDGTVVAVGNNDKGQLDVSTWKDIVAIAGGRYHTIGLKKDNTFLSIGLDDTNQSTDNSNTSSSDPVKTPVSSGEIEYHNIGNEGESTYLISKSGNSITNAKYTKYDYQLSYTSEKDIALFKIKTAQGKEYVGSINCDHTANDSKGSPIAEDILKVLRVDGNSSMDQVLTFSLAERIDDDDSSKGYTNWIELDDKFIFEEDFEDLFMDFGNISYYNNYLLSTIYPGRFDISRYKTGADLDLSAGFDYSYLLFNDDNSVIGGKKLYLDKILSEYTRLTWYSNIPDDFELNKTFYACNTVYISSDKGNGSESFTTCSAFAFRQIKLGVTYNRLSGIDTHIILFEYANKWMYSKADKTFKINIEVPEFDINYDFETTLEFNDAFKVDIFNEIKDKVEITESTPDEFKAYVKVVAKGVGNYLSSDPYEFVLTLKKADFTK